MKSTTTDEMLTIFTFLQTLLAAVEAAGLADTFKTVTEGVMYTLLAPTDEAFAKLPAGTLDGTSSIYNCHCSV